MEEKVLNRMEELSRTIGDLIDRREQVISDLRRIDSEIDSLSMVVFELKSLLDDTESTESQID